MAELAAAAAIIAITDVSLRSIKGLYDFFQEYKDVANLLKDIDSAISHLQTRLSGLGFLSQADEETLKLVKETGITDAINDCGAACEEFQNQLKKWKKNGVVSIRDKLRVMWHSAKVDKYKMLIQSTLMVLDSVVGILTLKIMWAGRAANDKSAELERLKNDVANWKAIAEEEQKKVSKNLDTLKDSDDDEAEYATEELKKEEKILSQFMGRCETITKQFGGVKLNQIITETYVGEDAHVQLGMPDSAVDKVGNQTIRNTITEKRATAVIGIFK